MLKITFTPANVSVEVPEHTPLLDAAKLAKVEIDAPCGGKGTCGKCIVKIIKGEVHSDSLGALSRSAVADGYVLACKTTLTTFDITVEIPEQLGRTGGKFTDAQEDSMLVRQDLFPQKWNLDQLSIKWLITVPKPELEDGLSDLDRLIKSIQKEWGKQEIVCDLSVIRDVADSLRANDGLVTVTLIREEKKIHLIAIEPGDKTSDHYGLAIDIGTTTIAVQLVYLPLAEVIDTLSDYNDQVTCGLDVISRINYAKKPHQLEELRERVLKTINNLIKQLMHSNNLKSEGIFNAVISANTTMVHLLLGLNPEYIRLEPYTPTLLKTPYLTAEDVGINIHPKSWIYISPNVGSYVGGDITAGILCTDLATESDDINLFIDIGTNGEIVLGNSDFLMTCACSAGPAFEGGGINCGMRAAIGAIEDVEVNKNTGACEYQTIGNVKPKGICGSGMIALLAKLFLTGWIDSAGKLNREKETDRIRINGRFAEYIIVTENESSTGKDLSISELDIENIIRAKAAIYSACALMLAQIGITFDDLSQLYIAGGFGRFLNLDHAKVLGLIPDLPKEKFKYIGNSSLMGSYMVLVSQDFREKQNSLANKMTYMELSTDPTYMDEYTAALFLPHTDLSLFPSIENLKINK
jgi:uncharacterized 2Fe-2S/4Fe-4S cluster protein (DUF4445 family)